MEKNPSFYINYEVQITLQIFFFFLNLPEISNSFTDSQCVFVFNTNLKYMDQEPLLHVLGKLVGTPGYKGLEVCYA